MAGMNDVRVLRNIIGDKYHPDDDMVPQFVNRRLKKMTLYKDDQSRNGLWSTVKSAFSGGGSEDAPQQPNPVIPQDKAQAAFEQGVRESTYGREANKFTSSSATDKEAFKAGLLDTYGDTPTMTTESQTPSAQETMDRIKTTELLNKQKNARMFGSKAPSVPESALAQELAGQYGEQNKAKAEGLFEGKMTVAEREKLIDIFRGKKETPLVQKAAGKLKQAWGEGSFGQQLVQSVTGASIQEQDQRKATKLDTAATKIMERDPNRKILDLQYNTRDKLLQDKRTMLEAELASYPTIGTTGKVRKDYEKQAITLKGRILGIEGQRRSLQTEKSGELGTMKTSLMQELERTPYQDIRKKYKIAPTTSEKFVGAISGAPSGFRAALGGMQGFSTGVSKQLGTNMGSSITGSFQDAGAAQRLRTTGLEKQAYLDFLRTKYKSPNASEEQLYTLASPTQKKRLEDINRRTGLAQSYAAGTGFLGGGLGRVSIAMSRPGQNLGKFTQIGARPTNLGSFAPEAFGRLGVTQSIGAITPTNKWDVLLGRTGGEDKIAMLLGKPAQPVPPLQAQNPTMGGFKFGNDRMAALLGKTPAQGSPEDPREKLRRFL